MSSQVLRRLIALFCISLLAFSTVACDEEADDEEATEEEEQDEHEDEVEDDEEDEQEDEQAEAGLPDETEVLDLDEGEAEVPATIEVPVNASTAVDTPTSVRIEYEDDNTGSGELFGIEIREATEFDTDLEHIWNNLDEDEHELVELDDELLRYVRPDDALGRTSNRFVLLVELDDNTWRCSQGNYGGYSEEQVDRQIEACRTLTAK